MQSDVGQHGQGGTQDGRQGGAGAKGVVFFIDKQQFKADTARLSVRSLLVEYAKEDPAQTTLVLRQGNELRKFENLDEVITVENGDKFTVFHNGPTTVS